MAVDDLWYRTKRDADGKPIPSARHGRGRRWRVRWADPETGRQRTELYSKKSDAECRDANTHADLSRGQYLDPRDGKITFAEYVRQWEAHQIHSPNTRASVRATVASVTFGDVQMRALRPSHVQAWIKRMEAGDPAAQKPRKLAASTIEVRVTQVRSIFKAAIRDRVIATDPSQGVTLPRKRRAEVAMTIPTDAQVGRLIQAADPAFAPFLAVCAFAGLRGGEASGLQVGDVAFLERKIEVRRQVQRAEDNTLDVRPPKYGSERTVHVPAELTTMLSTHVAQLGGIGPGRWLFAGTTGQPADRRGNAARWNATCKAAGVDGFTLHDLRHYYASGLIADGCDPVTVQHALGHSKPSITLDTYSHLWPSAEDRTRQAAATLMASALSCTESVPASSG